MGKLKENTDEKKAKPVNQISAIQKKVEEALNQLLQSDYYCIYPTDTKEVRIYAGVEETRHINMPYSFYVHITKDDKADLINLTTAVYLSNWLQSDSNAKTNVNCFAQHKLCSVDEHQRLYKEMNDKGTRSLLYRGEVKFRDMLALQKMQAEHEQVGKNADFTVKKVNNVLIRQSPENVPPKDPHAKGGNGTWYSLVDICTLDWMTNGKFRIYDSIVYRTKLFKDDNNTLRDDYNAYFQAINDLKNCKDSKTYVISAIMIQKIEVAFQHMLAAYFAQGLISTPNLPMAEALTLSQPWLGRLQYPSSVRTDISSMQTMPYDVLGYGTISDLLQEKSPFKQVQTINKYLIKQSILQDILFYTQCLPPPEEMPSWQKKDYQDAAEFFKTCYPIIEHHTSAVLPPPEKWSNKMCRTIRQFYKQISPQGLDELREFAQRKSRIRNSRS